MGPPISHPMASHLLCTGSRTAGADQIVKERWTHGGISDAVYGRGPDPWLWPADRSSSACNVALENSGSVRFSGFHWVFLRKGVVNRHGPGGLG